MPREGSYVEGFVHPKIVHQHKDKKLSKDMLHYTYETWDQYLRKMNQYSTLAAEKSKKEGKKEGKRGSQKCAQGEGRAGGGKKALRYFACL